MKREERWGESESVGLSWRKRLQESRFALEKEKARKRECKFALESYRLLLLLLLFSSRSSALRGSDRKDESGG